MRRHDGNKKYDGEVLFCTWCEWGAAATNTLLMDFAKDRFGAKSQMGPTYSMWNWAFHNPEASFELYKEYWFNAYPDRPPLTFQEYLVILQGKGANKNVSGGRRGLERFCAKYQIPIKFNVNPKDVIQITRPNHALFQSLMIVDSIEGENVKAYFFIPDRIYPEPLGRETVFQSLGMGDFGVVGKSIVS